MVNLETGKNDVDHGSIVIFWGCTDSSSSIRHCSSNELHILLSQRASPCYDLEDSFYHPTVIGVILSIISSFVL